MDHGSAGKDKANDTSSAVLMRGVANGGAADVGASAAPGPAPVAVPAAGPKKSRRRSVGGTSKKRSSSSAGDAPPDLEKLEVDGQVLKPSQLELAMGRSRALELLLDKTLSALGAKKNTTPSGLKRQRRVSAESVSGVTAAGAGDGAAAPATTTAVSAAAAAKVDAATDGTGRLLPSTADLPRPAPAPLSRALARQKLPSRVPAASSATRARHSSGSEPGVVGMGNRVAAKEVPLAQSAAVAADEMVDAVARMAFACGLDLPARALAMQLADGVRDYAIAILTGAALHRLAVLRRNAQDTKRAVGIAAAARPSGVDDDVEEDDEDDDDDDDSGDNADGSADDDEHEDDDVHAVARRSVKMAVDRLVAQLKRKTAEAVRAGMTGVVPMTDASQKDSAFQASVIDLWSFLEQEELVELAGRSRRVRQSLLSSRSLQTRLQQVESVEDAKRLMAISGLDMDVPAAAERATVSASVPNAGATEGDQPRPQEQHEEDGLHVGSGFSCPVIRERLRYRDELSAAMSLTDYMLFSECTGESFVAPKPRLRMFRAWLGVRDTLPRVGFSADCWAVVGELAYDLLEKAVREALARGSLRTEARLRLVFARVLNSSVVQLQQVLKSASAVLAQEPALTDLLPMSAGPSELAAAALLAGGGGVVGAPPNPATPLIQPMPPKRGVNKIPTPAVTSTAIWFRVPGTRKRKRTTKSQKAAAQAAVGTSSAGASKAQLTPADGTVLIGDGFGDHRASIKEGDENEEEEEGKEGEEKKKKKTAPNEEMEKKKEKKKEKEKEKKKVKEDSVSANAASVELAAPPLPPPLPPKKGRGRRKKKVVESATAVADSAVTGHGEEEESASIDESERLNCCGRIILGATCIFCTRCDQWRHADCEDVDPDDYPDERPFICNLCQQDIMRN